MPIMTTAQFRVACSPIQTKVFDGIYRQREKEYSKIFTEEDGLARSISPETILYGFGPAPQKSQGDVIVYDSGGEQFTYNYIYQVYALGAAITEEAMQDGEWFGLVKKNAKHLAISQVDTKETLTANVLNRAFDTSVTYGDGVNLCSASHPVYSGNQSNLLTSAALSQTSLEAGVATVQKARNFRGIPISLKIKSLVVPPDLSQTAYVLLNSPLRAGTTNNDVSPIGMDGNFKNGCSTITRLTNAASWFFDTDVEGDGLKVLNHPNSKNGKIEMEGDFNSNSMRQKTSERYAVGVTNWLGVFGNQGV